MILLGHELKANVKSLLIWSLTIAVCSVGLVLMFESVADGMKDVAASFSQMGDFSKAFGMDKLNISTLNGYYATEVARIITIGGAMYAALIGISILSKEEEEHTAEFLYTFPRRRSYILVWKYMSLLVLLLFFNLITTGAEVVSFFFVDGKIDMEDFAVYHALTLLMEIEIASFCFLLSAFNKRRQVGLAMGIAIIAYLADIMCRIVPDIEFIKYLTPFYFSNVADIFSHADLEFIGIGVAVLVTVISYLLALTINRRRDLKV